MSGLLNNSLFLSTAAAAGGYQIERSLRFNSSDSAYLSRTPAVAGNRTTWTWAGWVKRSAISSAATQIIFDAFSSTGSNYFLFQIRSSDVIQIFFGPSIGELITTPVYRDASAWYHMVLAYDTTQATPANRVRLYVNNVEVNTFSTATYPSQNNANNYVNSTVPHHIGAGYTTPVTEFFSGYLADIHFIDGQQLTPAAFTEVSATTGQLIPKAYTGSFGTNGFWLKFSDNSAATATTLGKDYSPNGNNWTPNNLTASSKGYIDRTSSTTGFASAYPKELIFDGTASSTSSARTVGQPDTITINFPAPISVNTLRVYVYQDNVNTTQTVRVNGGTPTNTTLYGIWDWLSVPFTGNMTQLTYSSGAGVTCGMGAIEVNGSILTDSVSSTVDSLVDTPTSIGTDTGLGGQVTGNYATLNPLKMGSFTLSNGNLDCVSTSSYGLVLGTIGMSSGKWYFETTLNGSGAANSIGIATDAVTITQYPGYDSLSWVYLADGRKINGGSRTSYGASFTTGDVIGVAFDADAGSLTFYKNGSSQGTAFTGLTSGPYFPVVGDDSSGSQAEQSLNFGQRQWAYAAPAGFKALCDTNLPAPVVAKPNTAMDVITRAGGGTTQTFATLRPGLVWEKRRDSTSSHYLFDVNRGNDKHLSSDTTSAEGSTAGAFTFNTNSYTVSSGFDWPGGATVVDWVWDAGTSTVSNTQGSITSQVRANVSAGFSIVTWTGTGSLATIGHGLGVAPAFIVIKRRNATTDWDSYHESLGNTKGIALNSTAAASTGSGYWDNTSPTSTVFTVNTGVQASGGTYVAYCFAPVVGYSNGFSYTGNGSTDGVFQYLGFRPRLILLKCSSTTGNWTLVDTSREGYNVDNDPLYPNLSNAEGTTDLLDITSNGFKLRTTDASVNSSGATYIGFAWAEAPFAYSRAR